MQMASSDVAFLLPDLEGGGAERAVLYLAEHFANSGYKTDLLLTRAHGPLLTRVPSKVRLFDFADGKRVEGPRLASTALCGLVRYLRTTPPRCLLSSLTGTNLVALVARKLARTPIRLVLREANTRKNVRSRMTALAMRMLYPSADAVVAVSEGVAKDLVIHAKVDPHRVEVVHTPVNVERLQRLAGQTPDHDWLTEGTVPVVLGVGRLVPQKNFSLLLRAFFQVRQSLEAKLILLGDGPLRKDLENQAKVLGIQSDVSMPGFVDNPYCFMSRAAVVTLSSEWEGLPNVLVEALAVGTPVVATDCHSGPREILRDGQYGWLTPTGDSEALAAAIIKALSGENPAPRDERLRRAQCFSQDRALLKYLEILLPNPRKGAG